MRAANAPARVNIPPSSTLSPLAVKVLPAFALAGVVAALLPGHARDGSASPPSGMLLFTAALVTALTTGALYLALRRDLRLPVTVALTAVAYNALVVALKFVLGPLGLYEENRRRDLDSLFAPDSLGNALLAAAVVFALYLAAFVVLYRLVRGGLVRPSVRSSRARAIGLAVIVGVLLLAAGGGTLLVVPLLFAGAGFGYLDFVLSSTWALLIGIAVAGAATLAGLALRGVREQSAALGDAAMLVTFFWIGVAFLALYHVLWVVYILVLTSIWPLRTVTPK